MSSNGTKKVATNLDFSTGAKLKNLPAAAATGEALEYSQAQDLLLAKQDNMTGGSGITLDGATINVDLTEGGTDYASITVSGAYVSALDGVYTRATARGYNATTSAASDLDYRHNAGDFAWFYKDNGGGVYAMMIANTSDGTLGVSAPWYAYLVSVDPSTLSADQDNLYSGAGSHFVASSSESDENSALVPDDTSPYIAYSTGSGASYLKFSSSELQCDVVTDVANVATGKLIDSNTVKTYIDEQDVISRTASSNTFVNTVAQLSGNPANVQSAIESAASEINTLDSQVVTLQNTDVTHTSQINSHSSVLGVSNLDNDFGSWAAPGAEYIGAANLTARAAIQGLGDSIDTVYDLTATLAGVASGETDFGTGFIILSNNASAKTLFQEIEVELQNLSQGVGQFWAPVEARENTNVNIASPADADFDGYTASNGDRILLKGQTLSYENGIYVFNGIGVAMTRSTDADLSAEFSQNKTVQVLNSATAGVSGSTWAYTGADDPTLGVDALTFEIKSQGVVGDGSVTDSKLSSSLSTEIDNKTDKHAEDVTLVADTPLTINHNLDTTDVIVQVKDSSNNYVDLEVDGVDSNNITIRSSFGFSGRVICIG